LRCDDLISVRCQVVFDVLSWWMDIVFKWVLTLSVIYYIYYYYILYTILLLYYYYDILFFCFSSFPLYSPILPLSLSLLLFSSISSSPISSQYPSNHPILGYVYLYSSSFPDNSTPHVLSEWMSRVVLR